MYQFARIAVKGELMKRLLLVAVLGIVIIGAQPCRADDYTVKMFAVVPLSTAFYRDVQTLEHISHCKLLPIACFGNRHRILTRYEFAVTTKRFADAMPDIHIQQGDAMLTERIMTRLKKEFSAELRELTEGSKPTSKPAKANGS